MSILLEALRQKSRNDVDIKRDDAQALTLTADHSALPEYEDVKLSDSTLSLESLLEPLHIQPPEHLSWQLSAADTRHLSASDIENQGTAQLGESAALELLFPIADDALAVAEGSSSDAVMTHDALSLELPSWSLVVAKPESDSILNVVADEASEQGQVDRTLSAGNVNDAHEESLVIGMDVDIPSNTIDVVDTTVQHSDITPSIAASEANVHVADRFVTQEVMEKMPPVFETPSFNAAKVNTPASASSYLNLLNKTHNTLEQPILSKKIRLQNPSISPAVLMGSVLVATIAGIGYYGFSLWEDDKTQLANQMARYEEPIVLPTRQHDDIALSNADIALKEHQLNSGSLPAPVLDNAGQEIERPVKSHGEDTKKRRQVANPILSQHQEVASVTKGLSISNLVNNAWNSWRQGDVVAAEKGYRQVLERQPNNRDALMGMFAITQLQPATNAQSQEIAERLIELYPQDEEVKALVANVFYTNGVSAEHNESYLKNQLQNTPNNAATYYQLGIVYASAKRWSDAQGAFFKAVSLESGQPEYLANLAISYDQLGKVELAISGYQKALDAARIRPSHLSQDALIARLQFLSLQASQSE
jgi:tetratricopeptide (TPR) repeat protein